ncbi:hypothetical protein COL36_06555 [Bacillus wiedmannii]|uniref:hypothetical protein n=1 Tax=Bacillus wiedmannii TaxID=1890302 RepID=UPI000BF9B2D5|nr:hypothetical protein [Bacillus wiedmannii]PFX62964.1 hypothetical protein COL36_06555 [Bacillus wiedmannii]
MGITKEMLINATKEMKDAEKRAEVFEKLVEIQNEVEAQRPNIRHQSDNEKGLWLDKVQLLGIVKSEEVTDINTIQTIIELIEIMNENHDTSKEGSHSYYWDKIYGWIAIESGLNSSYITTRIKVCDGKLLVCTYNDECEYDSLKSIFDKIRIDLRNAQ